MMNDDLITDGKEVLQLTTRLQEAHAVLQNKEKAVFVAETVVEQAQSDVLGARARLQKLQAILRDYIEGEIAADDIEPRLKEIE